MIKPHLLVVLIVVSSCFAEDIERLTLSDGRVLIGVYNESQNTIKVVSFNGFILVNLGDRTIISRSPDVVRPVDVKPPIKEEKGKANVPVYIKPEFDLEQLRQEKQAKLEQERERERLENEKDARFNIKAQEFYKMAERAIAQQDVNKALSILDEALGVSVKLRLNDAVPSEEMQLFTLLASYDADTPYELKRNQIDGFYLKCTSLDQSLSWRVFFPASNKEQMKMYFSGKYAPIAFTGRYMGRDFILKKYYPMQNP
jgi:hypothetical protein